MKKILCLVLALVMIIGMVACGKKESNKLVIYNSNTDDWTAPILEAFTKETGIEVEIVSGGAAELMSRIASEGDNPQGDVVWGGTIDTLAASAEYLEAYKSTEYDAIFPEFRDPEYRWYPDTVDPFVIAYNTDRVTAEEAPTGWHDVLEPEWTGEIGMPDPAKSGTAYTVICTLLTVWGKGDGAYANLEKFVENLGGRLAGGSSSMIQAVVDGEYKIGLTFEEAVLKYRDSGSPLEIVYPDDGTTVLAGGIAVIKGAKNMDNAKKFLDFVLSLETQSTYANFNRRSCRSDITLPEGTSMCALSEVKQNPFDLAWCTETKPEILEHWDAYVAEYIG